MPNRPKCKVEHGIDGKRYAIFHDSTEAWIWRHLFSRHPVACFGQYENAYCLDEELPR